MSADFFFAVRFASFRDVNDCLRSEEGRLFGKNIVGSMARGATLTSRAPQFGRTSAGSPCLNFMVEAFAVPDRPQIRQRCDIVAGILLCIVRQAVETTNTEHQPPHRPRII
jgi:hypothetical protein